MRIGIIGWLHESNTFVPGRTGLKDFEADVLVEGDNLVQAFSRSHHEIGGMLAELEQEKAEIVPLLAARAIPGGVITEGAFEHIWERMYGGLSDAGPLDGVLAAAHGATVAEHAPDADGTWLERLRGVVGPETPCIATLDPHANLSTKMLASVDAICAYQTNPHLDQESCGRRAAGWMAGTIRGTLQPRMAAARPPLILPIEHQNTSEPPCSRWLEHARELCRSEGLLSVQLLLGFPYADVAEMGSATVAVADGSEDLAADAARALAGRVWRDRDALAIDVLTADEAVARGLQMPSPVCLLDMGDNVGGGSPGDGTILVHAVRERARHDRAPVRALACLVDPEAVEAARNAGQGERVALRIGGHTGALHGPPLDDEVTVIGVHDGAWREPRPRHGGFASGDQGPCAVVETADGLTLLLNSRRTPPFSLAPLRACNLRPEAFQLLIAKGVQAPRAAYGEVCRSFLAVHTPGSTAADPRQLTYEHRRRPMYPFEGDATWTEAQDE